MILSVGNIAEAPPEARERLARALGLRPGASLESIARAANVHHALPRRFVLVQITRSLCRIESADGRERLGSVSLLPVRSGRIENARDRGELLAWIAKFEACEKRS